VTGERDQDLRPPKRLILRAALRSVLIAAVLVVLYYMLPLDRPWDSDTAIRLLIGLVVVAGVMVWGVRIIAGSRYPGLRAAEALALVLPFFLLLFASTYFVMERASAASFTQPLGRTDALYFTVTVFLHGGVRGHHRQIRDCPGRAHRPDARRPRTSRRRHTGTPGGRTARPGTTTGDRR
jgi:hypothetical protein